MLCYASKLATPFGMLAMLADSEQRLTHLHFVPETTAGAARDLLDRLAPDAVWSHGHFDAAARQLTEYAQHHRKVFELELAPRGTDFQRRVWDELLQIRYGDVLTYAELAQRIGLRNGARAVGRAVATNPLAIVIPCHRVVGSRGQLTGYAGGLAVKDALLVHEGVRAPLLFPQSQRSG